MKRFVQAACVAGAVILSAAGCCSSCGSKHAASAAPCATGQCGTSPYAAAARPASPTTPPVGTYGTVRTGMPQMIPATVQTGSASVSGEMPTGGRLP
jgi:hypothetical protein